MDSKFFWNNISDLMRQKNIKIEKLASELKMNSTTLNNMISHKEFPSVDKAFIIANTLDTTVEYLLTGSITIRYNANNNFMGNYEEHDIVLDL